MQVCWRMLTPFYADDKYDAALLQLSGLALKEGSLSTSVLSSGNDLTLAILRPRRVETKRSATIDETIDIEQLENWFLPLPDRDIGKILDVDERSQIATLTSTTTSSSASHLRQENSKITISST